MRIGIYFSGIIGTILLVLRVIGIFFEFHQNDVFLIVGLFLLLFVFLPLSIVYKRSPQKKTLNSITSYKGTENKATQQKKGKVKTKGWGMNDSPFRERKSGLSWGGGNIKGAKAARGTRRTFLR